MLLYVGVSTELALELLGREHGLKALHFALDACCSERRLLASLGSAAIISALLDDVLGHLLLVSEILELSIEDFQELVRLLVVMGEQVAAQTGW